MSASVPPIGLLEDLIDGFNKPLDSTWLTSGNVVVSSGGVRLKLANNTASSTSSLYTSYIWDIENSYGFIELRDIARGIDTDFIYVVESDNNYFGFKIENSGIYGIRGTISGASFVTSLLTAYNSRARYLKIYEELGEIKLAVSRQGIVWVDLYTWDITVYPTFNINEVVPMMIAKTDSSINNVGEYNIGSFNIPKDNSKSQSVYVIGQSGKFNKNPYLQGTQIGKYKKNPYKVI